MSLRRRSPPSTEQSSGPGQPSDGTTAVAAALDQAHDPGMARLVRAIAARPTLAQELTAVGRTVAIVGNGAAVLGLGSVGPRASLPVLEGKALLLHELAGLHAVPLAVDATAPDRIVATIKAVAPSFGAILLEHVGAPACFEVESLLDAQLRIPVVHDDRACIAVATLAALLGAARRVGRPLAELAVGIVGMGPEGTGIAQLLLAHGVHDLRGTDVDPDALERLRELGGRPDSLAAILASCDVIVAITGKAGMIPAAAIRPGQVIVSLSGATPADVELEAALAAGAAVAVDGRSVDSVLAFPGLLRGALEAGASSIGVPMLLAAAHALAGLTRDGALLPDPFDPHTHATVAAAVRDAA